MPPIQRCWEEVAWTEPFTERLDLTNPVAWDDAGVADLPVASSGLAGCDEVEAFGFNTVSGTELAGKLVVVGCGQWTAELPDSFIYDVATNTWASWDNLNTARRNYAGALEKAKSFDIGLVTEQMVHVYEQAIEDKRANRTVKIDRELLKETKGQLGLSLANG